VSPHATPKPLWGCPNLLIPTAIPLPFGRAPKGPQRPKSFMVRVLTCVIALFDFSLSHLSSMSRTYFDYGVLFAITMGDIFTPVISARLRVSITRRLWEQTVSLIRNERCLAPPIFWLRTLIKQRKEVQNIYVTFLFLSVGESDCLYKRCAMWGMWNKPR